MVRAFRQRGMILMALVAMALLVIIGTVSGVRTFSIVASTMGGQITFRGESNNWVFSEATVCRLREVPDMARAEGPGDVCSARFFDAKADRDVLLEWKDGTSVAFSRNGDGGFTVKTLSDQTEGLPKGSLVIVPASAWGGHWALGFQGIVRLGGALGTGSRDYLIDGEWEARQQGLAMSLLRNVTEVVKAGTLTRGSIVDVVRRQDGADDWGEVVSYGHVTPASVEDPGVEVALLTERGPLALRVEYYGARQPSIFLPDWMDTVASSPVLVALAILLSFILVVIELFFAIPVGGGGHDSGRHSAGGEVTAATTGLTARIRRSAGRRLRKGSGSGGR